MTDRQPGKPSFRRVSASASTPDDPEALFESLKKAPGVQYLWSHQADVLRQYHEDCLSKRDIALELPTGAGKTLIGLLVAEYRRQKFDERALYLCPTRQLARQVGEQADAYGIPARVILPSGYEGLDHFRLGEAIGVTTYKAVFNTNPRFTDPQAMILDDAHAAEDHIASLWSVRISRHENPGLYRKVLRSVMREMNAAFVETMFDDEASPEARAKVDLLPQPGFVELAGEVRGLLDSALDEHSKQRFPWSRFERICTPVSFMFRGANCCCVPSSPLR
jgi:Rad3-related DNA helicase